MARLWCLADGATDPAGRLVYATSQAGLRHHVWGGVWQHGEPDGSGGGRRQTQGEQAHGRLCYGLPAGNVHPYHHRTATYLTLCIA